MLMGTWAGVKKRTVEESSAAPYLGRVGDCGGKLARLLSPISEVGAILMELMSWCHGAGQSPGHPPLLTVPPKGKSQAPSGES